jgi:hypothetical protein
LIRVRPIGLEPDQTLVPVSREWRVTYVARAFPENELKSRVFVTIRRFSQASPGPGILRIASVMQRYAPWDGYTPTSSISTDNGNNSLIREKC